MGGTVMAATFERLPIFSYSAFANLVVFSWHSGNPGVP